MSFTESNVYRSLSSLKVGLLTLTRVALAISSLKIRTNHP